jgi:tetratricopeptide (TPR) repeat protein
MKKISFVTAGILSLFLCAASSRAEDRPYVSALRSLAINRSLLTKAEAEYQALLDEEHQGASVNISKLLENLRYKIQAYRDDAQRLQDALPGDVRAEEFLKELVQRQTQTSRPNPVDTEKDKKIEEKVRSIYRLHEEALSYVAKNRYEDAEKIYQEIVLLSPDDDEAYLLLGHTCLAAGHYEKAGEAFRNAIHIDPANAQEIPRLYENILVENPSDDEAMAQLGFSHLFLGNARQARQFFEEALKLNASNQVARRGLMELQG